MLTAKEYLNRVRTADRLIKLKKRELRNLKLNLVQISPQTTRERVQSSGSGDITKTVDDIVDLQNKINGEVDELVRLKAEVREKINKLDDTRFITVLTEYYINCKKWKQVAESMDYDLRWIYRLHEKALKKFDKIIN